MKAKLFGVTRHKNHEILTNDFENPTKFYHYYNNELVAEFNTIGECIKSVEEKSGDKISEELKTQLTFNF